MKKLLPIPLSLLLLLATTKTTLAHCPLCVAGAGAGLTLSRWLGIDDSITGIWLAAFLAAISLWFAGSLKKKYIKYQDFLIYIGIFATTLWSFYAFNLINEHAGMIMGLPKLTTGILIGGLLFYILETTNQYIIQKKGKVLFPYQRLITSLGGMFILSVLMYIFINYFI